MRKYKIYIMIFLSALILAGCDQTDNTQRKEEETAEKYSVYSEFIKNEEFAVDISEVADKESLGCHLVDMDGDDIPELLISEGSYSAARVLLYTYNDSKVHFVGAFSRYASIDLWTKENESIFRSHYGNQGCFKDVYSSFADGKVKTIAFFASEPEDIGSENNVYYVIYPFPEVMDDEVIKVQYYDPMYKVTEEEYEHMNEKLYEYMQEQGFEYKTIRYDDIFQSKSEIDI